MANQSYPADRIAPSQPTSLLLVETDNALLGWIGVFWQGDRVFALTFGHSHYAEAQAAAQEKAKIRAASPPSRPTGTSHSANQNHQSGLYEPGLGESGDGVLPADFPAAEMLAAELKAYAAGEPTDFTSAAVVLDELPPFAKRVLSHCRDIPYGEVLSYGELAAAAGSPRAARAVGTAMSQNFVPLIVPCHRVIAAGRKLGGYSAADGLKTKQRLLELEGSWTNLKPTSPASSTVVRM